MKEKRSKHTWHNDTHTDFAVFLFNAIRIYIDVSVSDFIVSVRHGIATPTTHNKRRDASLTSAQAKTQQNQTRTRETGDTERIDF